MPERLKSSADRKEFPVGDKLQQHIKEIPKKSVHPSVREQAASPVPPKKKEQSGKKTVSKDTKPAVSASTTQTIPAKEIPQSKRTIEKVLVGSWNAVKKVPEKQGEWILHQYDKMKFPKVTPEEKKLADKVHVFLKKHQKAVGWGATATEVAVTTLVIVKGYQLLRRRFVRRSPIPAPTPAVTDLPETDISPFAADRHEASAPSEEPSMVPDWFRDTPVADPAATHRIRDGAASDQIHRSDPQSEPAANQVEKQLPKYLREILDDFSASVEAKVSSTDGKDARLRNLLKHSWSQLLVQGVPPHVESMLSEMRQMKEPKDIAAKGMEALIAWNEWLTKEHKHPLDNRQMIGMMVSFNMIGFDKLAALDTKKMSGWKASELLPLVERIFPVLVMEAALPEQVKRAQQVLTGFLNRPLPDDLPFHDNPGQLREILIPIATKFYEYLHKDPSVIQSINLLPNWEEQSSGLANIFTKFSEQFTKFDTAKGMTEGQRDTAKFNILILSFMLDQLKFPGIEELGIRLKE
jgi:hypothetical protein